jgi:hypothetical protein
MTLRSAGIDLEIFWKLFSTAAGNDLGICAKPFGLHTSVELSFQNLCRWPIL